MDMLDFLIAEASLSQSGPMFSEPIPFLRKPSGCLLIFRLITNHDSPPYLILTIGYNSTRTDATLERD